MIRSEVVISNCSVKENKGGGKWYLQGKLKRVGEDVLDFKFWDYRDPEDASQEPKAAKDGFYLVEFKIDQWKGINQAVISAMKETEHPSQELRNCAVVKPIADIDIEDVLKRLSFYISSIENEAIKDLVKMCLSVSVFDWNSKWESEDIVDVLTSGPSKFTEMWGARSPGHHSYTGGWLVHTYEVLDGAMGILSASGRISEFHRSATAIPAPMKDATIASAILHDIGKFFEYDISSGMSCKRSDVGDLHSGHLFLSVRVIDRVIDMIDNLRNSSAGSLRSGATGEVIEHIMHAVASHHGLDGNPESSPRTIPAICLHHADAATSSITKIKDNIFEAEGGRKKHFGEMLVKMNAGLY